MEIGNLVLIDGVRQAHTLKEDTHSSECNRAGLSDRGRLRGDRPNARD